VAGESKAKVIPLHGSSARAAARRVGQRADAARRHPSLMADGDGPVATEQIAAVVHEIDSHPAFNTPLAEDRSPNELSLRISAISEFLRKRLDGDYVVDEFGFDPHLNDAVFMPVLRGLFRNWFRVAVSGIENLPETGAALVVANHAGVLPLDGLMASVAVHDHHPGNRDLRMLAADLVFDMPVLGQAARKAGHTMACTSDAHRLLAGGELTAVFPEGYKGLGKHFRDRYKLQRFGRGGFVSAAIRTHAPIVPCSIVGSEEIYPMVADVKLLARLFGLPYFPVTPFFPLAGLLGAVPLPSKWHIEFGEPIETTGYDASAADDPMITFELTDQVRETIQQTLYQLLAGRRNMFFD